MAQRLTAQDLPAARRWRRRWVWVVVAVGAAVVAGVALVWALSGRRDSMEVAQTSTPVWKLWLSATMMVLVVTMAVAYLVLVRRGGLIAANRESPLWTVSWRERRRLVEVVRRSEAPSGPEGQLVRAAAEQLRRGRLMVVLPVALALTVIGQALMYKIAVAWLIAGLMLVLLALVVVVMLRDARAAERFLAAHPWKR